MFDDMFHEIIYAIPPNQKMKFPDEIKDEINVFEGIPSVAGDSRPRLLIIDDQMQECGEEVMTLFTRGSHHFNISVIVLTQNIFISNPCFRTISLNAHYIILFKNPRALDQITVLARQICPTNMKFFQEAYEDSCREPHTYILLDMTQACKDEMRFRTKIFPDDDNSTTIYLPRIMRK